MSFKNDSFSMSLVMVGAVNVGCISLIDQGIIAPSKYRNSVKTFNNSEDIKHYKKGQEIGMFNLGSTVILLINKINGNWSENISNDKKILIRDEMLKKL